MMLVTCCKRSRNTGDFTRYQGIILVLLIFSSNLIFESYVYSQSTPQVTIYDTYTCRFYNSTYHYPDIITDYYETTDSAVILWLNMSFIPTLNLTIKWIYPNSTLHRNIPHQLPSVSFNETNWCDQNVSLPIRDNPASHVLGEWTVEVYQGETQVTQHKFHIIDKDSSEWNYGAKILSVESPTSVEKNEYFTVDVLVQYSFKTKTLLTPGIWDAKTEELFMEIFDWVEGEGTKTYSLGVYTMNNTGVFHMEAAAFYLVSDEWIIDDDGYKGFEVEVKEPLHRTNLLYALGVISLIVALMYVYLKKRAQTT